MPYKENTPENREKAKESRRKYYYKNKQSEINRIATRQKNLRNNFEKYKSSLYCSICKEDHISCLEFHHIDQNSKKYNIADMVNNGHSINSIMSEIEKCIVLCSNCHRKLHYEEKNKV